MKSLALTALVTLAACGGDAAMTTDVDSGAAGSSAAGALGERVDSGEAGATVVPVAGTGGEPAGTSGGAGAAGSAGGATAGAAGTPTAGAAGASADQGGSAAAMAGAGGAAAGTGGSAPTCSLTITGAPIVFSDLPMSPGATSEERTVTITNASSEPLTIGASGFAARYGAVFCGSNPNHYGSGTPYDPNSGFSSSLACVDSDPLPPGSSCTLTFRFAIGPEGGRLGTVGAETCADWILKARGNKCGVISATMPSPRITIVQ